jgi:hypothetical protein
MNTSEESKLRDELELKCLFLHFVYVVAPGALHDDSFHKMLEAARDFVYQSTTQDFLNRVTDVSVALDAWISRSVKFLPTKIGIEEIAMEFAKLLNEQGDALYSNGVTFGWLSRLIDCAPLGLLEDLPYHAKIGLAAHAGNGSVEEAFLLHDAFFLLQITGVCHDKMLLAASQFSVIKSTDRNYLFLSTANQNTGSVARLCVFSFYAFVEAFVNSMGNDFAARHISTLTADELEILHGKKKGKYLSLEQKMESFQKIIRPDKTSPIVLTDVKQHKEPFTTFFSNIKEVRDASAHFGVGKASISRSPQEWLNFTDLTSRVALMVASEFWEICYPGRRKPSYLFGLDYQALKDVASERLEFTKQVFSIPTTGEHRRPAVPPKRVG